MKTIGLIGGMSWESSVTYYQTINYSVDFQEIEECQAKGNWEKSAGILSNAAISLEKAGADFILICTNTMHKVAARPAISTS